MLARDKDADIRQAAAEALGGLGDAAAVPPLIAALKDSDTSVRRQAAEALGQREDRRAVAPLIERLPTNRMRKSAGPWPNRSVSLATPPLSIRSSWPWPITSRWPAWCVRGPLGGSRTPRPWGGWPRGSLPTRMRRSAKPPPSLGASTDGPPPIRSSRPSRIPCRAFARRPPSTGTLKDTQALRPLAERLASDEDANVRQAVAKTLGELDDPASVPLLIAALADRDEHVRGAVIESLTPLADPRIVPAIQATLKDSSKSVRTDAAEALGQIGDPQTVPALLAALDDVQDDVRRNAVTALGKVGDCAGLGTAR